jgi:hypothetical protein
MWINTTTHAVYRFHHEIRAAFPNTSFPAFLSDALLAEFNVLPVGQIAPPAVDQLQFKAVELLPVCVDGDWRQRWDVRPLTTQEHTGQFAATLAAFDSALTAHLDATAQARRYDNRITCALRAGYAGPFRAEGAAFAAWMDTCNAQAYALLAAVQAGTQPMPESPEAFIATLPAMVWPA